VLRGSFVRVPNFQGLMSVWISERDDRLKDEEKTKPILVSKHQLVPKHEIVPRREAEELLQRLHIKPHQLPYMRADDPAARQIGAKPWDVVRISRSSPTAGEVVVYRYVIESSAGGGKPDQSS
jgi:DNA-directed RNA polymerase subunit H